MIPNISHIGNSGYCCTVVNVIAVVTNIVTLRILIRHYSSSSTLIYLISLAVVGRYSKSTIFTNKIFPPKERQGSFRKSAALRRVNLLTPD